MNVMVLSPSKKDVAYYPHWFQFQGHKSYAGWPNGNHGANRKLHDYKDPCYQGSSMKMFQKLQIPKKDIQTYDDQIGRVLKR